MLHLYYMEPNPYFKDEKLEDYIERLKNNYLNLDRKPKKYEEMYEKGLIPAHTTAIIGNKKLIKTKKALYLYETLNTTGEFDFSKEGFVHPDFVIPVLENLLPEMLTGTKIFIGTYSASSLVLSKPAFIHSMNEFSDKKVQWYLKDVFKLKELYLLKVMPDFYK